MFVGHQTTRDGTRWWWKGYGAGPGWKKVMDWWGLSTPKPPQWGTPPSQHIICIFTQPQFTENPWKCVFFFKIVYPLHLIGVFCFLPISIAHWEYLNICRTRSTMIFHHLKVPLTENPFAVSDMAWKLPLMVFWCFLYAGTSWPFSRIRLWNATLHVVLTACTTLRGMLDKLISPDAAADADFHIQ